MNRRCHGFTLLELIIFMVVVAAGLAGILSAMDSVVKSSADPMVRKQAVVLAESLLEEIMLKEYCDPDTVDRTATPPHCPARVAADQEASRDLYDDVDDYHGKTETLFNSASGAAGWPVALDGYLVTIAVPTTTLGDSSPVPAKKVTITVSRGSESISLSGYRANY